MSTLTFLAGIGMWEILTIIGLFTVAIIIPAVIIFFLIKKLQKK